ncbi:MAG TPA: hypothetical protein VFO60_00910, partial [Candidatus Dormibacteraeota bacterium]|nr:hypothetical protein [Candidatus Dormibacteraeota bacterium]
ARLGDTAPVDVSGLCVVHGLEDRALDRRVTDITAAVSGDFFDDLRLLDFDAWVSRLRAGGIGWVVVGRDACAGPTAALEAAWVAQHRTTFVPVPTGREGSRLYRLAP